MLRFFRKQVARESSLSITLKRLAHSPHLHEPPCEMKRFGADFVLRVGVGTLKIASKEDSFLAVNIFVRDNAPA